MIKSHPRHLFTSSKLVKKKISKFFGTCTMYIRTTNTLELSEEYVLAAQTFTKSCICWWWYDKISSQTPIYIFRLCPWVLYIYVVYSPDSYLQVCTNNETQEKKFQTWPRGFRPRQYSLDTEFSKTNFFCSIQTTTVFDDLPPPK